MLDVGHHTGGGCGGEGYDGDVVVVDADAGDFEIGWSKVVAPLRDAVGFVDGNEGNFHLPEVLDEYTLLQSLWRDVEYLYLPVNALVEDDFLFGGGETGNDAGTLYSTFVQLLHLVFHQ